MTNNSPKSIRVRTRRAPQDSGPPTADSAVINSDGHDPHQPVGYGNPPRKTQFKKGQSGNPRGRPRQKKALSTIVDEVLYKQVEITEAGRKRKVSAVEALLIRQLAEAMKGDAKALDRLFKVQQMFGSPVSETAGEIKGPSEAEKAMMAELASWAQSGTDEEQIEAVEAKEEADD